MDNLSATSLNGARRALPRESSDELSCDTAGWQVAAARAATGTNPQHPAAAEPTMSSTLTSAPTWSPTGQSTAPNPIEPASLPPGPLSSANYEKAGARNRYLAGKYDPNSWTDRALNVFTGAMTDPANVLTASEQNEHRALSAKIVETVFPQPVAAAARLDAMESSPVGAIAWVVAREAGASQRDQDFTLWLGRSVEGFVMAYAGPRAGLTFLNAQTVLVPREAAIAAEAAEARNGAKAAAGSKADEIETPVDSPGRWKDEEAQRTPRQRREGSGSSTPIIGSGGTAG
jgi:hypothetical protein